MPQVGTHTPVLADDGADLAAALRTVREIGDDTAFDAAVDDAFPGARVDVIAYEGRSRLVAALERENNCHSIVLEKERGATRVVGANALDAPTWKWPAR